ncbi:STAS domain-containing protein [Listeria welshimeri]|nr:STAS domain-containing protein [Listeria welshimeri]
MTIMNHLVQQKEIVVKEWLSYYVSVDDPYIFTLKNDTRLKDETRLVLDNLFIGMKEEKQQMNTFARELGKAQFITSLGISHILFHIRLLEKFMLEYALEVTNTSTNYQDLYEFNMTLHEVFSNFTQNLIEGYTIATEELMQQKENQMIKNSTKLIRIAEQVFLLPLSGTMTEIRAQQIIESALFETSAQPVSYLIIDLSGMQLESRHIGEYINQFFESLKLVGVTPIVTGMQPETAKIMINSHMKHPKGIQIFPTLRQATRALIKEKEASNDF